MVASALDTYNEACFPCMVDYSGFQPKFVISGLLSSRRTIIRTLTLLFDGTRHHGCGSETVNTLLSKVHAMV